MYSAVPEVACLILMTQVAVPSPLAASMANCGEAESIILEIVTSEKDGNEASRGPIEGLLIPLPWPQDSEVIGMLVPAPVNVMVMS